MQQKNADAIDESTIGGGAGEKMAVVCESTADVSICGFKGS